MITFDKNSDPNPKLTEALRKTLLSGKRRLEILDKLREKKIVERVEHDPPCHLVNLNHYGGQAFVSMEGELLGFVAEYQEANEITEEELLDIDRKLAHLHPGYFLAPSNDDQRKRGMQLLASKQIPINTPVMVHVRFPDGDMIQLDYEKGNVNRFYHTCIWAYECPDGELPPLVASQIDAQLEMSFDLVVSFTTDKYNKLYKYQTGVSEHWRGVRKKIFDTLPKDYWKRWQPYNSRNPLSKEKVDDK